MKSAYESIYIYISSYHLHIQEIFWGCLWGFWVPALHSAQRRKSDTSQYIPSVGCICEDKKEAIVEFINRKTDGLIGRNSFDVGIDATKAVKCARIFRHHKDIVGGSHPKKFISVEGMTKDDMKDCIILTRTKEKKS